MMLKRYNEFITEGLRSKLKANTAETIKQRLSQMDIIDWVKEVSVLKLDDSYLPSDSEIRNYLSRMNNEELIETIIIILGEKYYHLLPENPTYDGDLDCYDIESLPDNLTVNGNLDCSNNKLISLPDNLTVNGYLDCFYNELETLPSNLTVKGHLDCSNNKLISLPDNLTVNRYLDCSHNNLKTLPDNLMVNGGLYCSDQKTGIKLELPKSAKIDGKFIN